MDPSPYFLLSKAKASCSSPLTPQSKHSELSGALILTLTPYSLPSYNETEVQSNQFEIRI